MKISATDVPWDSAGNLVGFPGYGHAGQPGPEFDGGGHDWKPNRPFEARLHLTGITRGHSAARFTWETNHGIKMDMFMADMLRLVQAEGHVIEAGGIVNGEWIIVKRGANYGVTPFLPGDTPPPESY